ncbi:DUF6705 family protein [Flavobacterium lacus]|uniref:DUF6705 domain-containing protein n=1 Tax=Flavobacterium lacus TaxID=1353778 RepID=A0A328WP50_9FLAO|nr:DUF6705 family protein [Flavobacterium lacus]RAR48100.1 hypothetical protein B0I10_106102 [Flavobacterium lacus]
MKQIATLLLFLLFSGFCVAQAPELPLYGASINVQGAYYKDLNNDLDQFIGSWVFSDSNTTLTITIVKKTQFFNLDRNVYIDYLVGEYHYEVNNQTIVNSLSNLNQNFSNIYDYNIYGYSIINKRKAPVCPECNLNERRVKLRFKDPIRNAPGLSGIITLRRVDENGVQKTHMRLQQTGSIIPIDDTPPTYMSFHVPWGQYVLIKQP